MVSAFGSTETPTTSGADPTTLAQTMAAWVKKYSLDGIDVDYEAGVYLYPIRTIMFTLSWGDRTSMRSLRERLPSG